MMKRLFITKRCLFATALLFIGIFIYALYKYQVVTKENWILSFVRNFVPDFLWMISFYLVSVGCMKSFTNNYMFATAIYTFIISILFELCQFIGVIQGTCDVLDIGVYFIAILVAYTIQKYIFKGEDYEKN